jgi:3'-phosphoadenosine 5'-phosphosulfate sulfotransferase
MLKGYTHYALERYSGGWNIKPVCLSGGTYNSPVIAWRKRKDHALKLCGKLNLEGIK